MRHVLVKSGRTDSRATRGGGWSGATTSACLRHRSLWAADVGEVGPRSHESIIMPLVTFFVPCSSHMYESNDESNPRMGAFGLKLVDGVELKRPWEERYVTGGLFCTPTTCHTFLTTNIFSHDSCNLQPLEPPYCICILYCKLSPLFWRADVVGRMLPSETYV
jgi:hypothetical protein